MSEVFNEAIRLHNLPITVCFVLVLVYWGLTVIGLADADALEPDVDVDVEADLQGSAFGAGLARFFGLGDIPLLVLLSVCISFLWAGTMLANHHWNPSGSFPLAFGLLMANFVISLAITKVVTAPLRPVMRALKAGEKHRPVIGRTCRVKTSEVTESFGQAEAEDESGNPLLIHVRVSPGQKPLAKGDEAIVIERLKKESAFLVRKI